MGKNSEKRRLYYSCAMFSLFWSFFYAIRIGIYVITHRNKSVDEGVEWQVLQAMLSLMGLLISLSMFNAYRRDGSAFLIVSWMTWMLANFTLSLILVHIALFELFTGSRIDSIRFANDVVDVAHLVNAPGSIYFILLFFASNFMYSTKSSEVIFSTMKTPVGYEPLTKYEVLHLHEGIDEDEIVYYV